MNETGLAMNFLPLESTQDRLIQKTGNIPEASHYPQRKWYWSGDVATHEKILQSCLTLLPFDPGVPAN